MEQNNNRNTTLVPIDFSDTSLFALEHASAIAKVIQEKHPLVTLLHVIEDANFEPVTSKTKIVNFDKENLMVEGARNKLQQIINEFRERMGVEFDYIIASGAAYKKIADVATWIKADTIVMGTHGRTGWKSFIGGNATKVVQIAPCPVITVKERNMGKGYKNIVLPLDLTRETKQKVAWAMKMAKYYKATVHVVTVHEDDEFLARRVKANMRQVQDILQDNGVNVTANSLTEVSENFANTTVKFSQDINADLIIIMTQQERTFSEFIFGSYAQRIVNTSPIPVMCINPRADLEPIYDRIL
jgi:nucleotide-binding universal stress UspA family protein